MNNELIDQIEIYLNLISQIEYKEKELKALMHFDLPKKYSHKPYYVKSIPYLLYLILSYFLFLIFKNLNLPNKLIDFCSNYVSSDILELLKAMILSNLFNFALTIVFWIIVISYLSIPKSWSQSFYKLIENHLINNRQKFIKSEQLKVKRIKHIQIDHIQKNIINLKKQLEINKQIPIKYLNIIALKKFNYYLNLELANNLNDCILLFEKEQFQIEINTKLDTLITCQKQILKTLDQNNKL